jgi:MoxR-like ATPase
MVVLLDGPPGVGKTLTAESVAEAMKAPLYTMSAGELGTAADRVERRLSDILEMVTMWNAILLIDEADIFMEERGPHDLERNELVSSG